MRLLLVLVVAVPFKVLWQQNSPDWPTKWQYYCI